MRGFFAALRMTGKKRKQMAKTKASEDGAEKIL
jgi:hypothetical protein